MTGPTSGDISHKAARRALEAHFVDPEEGSAFDEIAAGRVYDHLRACDDCRRRFDALALADRGLVSGLDASVDGGADERVAGAFEATFAEASFGDALDAMLEAEADAPPPQGDDSEEVVSLDEKRNRRWRARAVFGAAAAVLLVASAALFFDTGDLLRGDDSEFAPRSAGGPGGQDGDAAPAEVAVFCAKRGPEGVDLTGADRAPLGLVSCPLDAEIKLAYRNESSELDYGAFFGVDQSGTIYWYGPTPSAKDPVRTRESSRLEPLADSIRLRVNHRPGSVRLIGLFSERPIDFERLERRIERVDTEALFRGETRIDQRDDEAMTTESFEITDGGSR